MALLLGLILFGLGTVVGSFVNVLIYRTVNGEDWVKGRSRCDRCKKQIYWFDNIPLLSYVFLGGKCRFCKKPISIQHPMIELLAGLLFAWWYLIGFTFFKLVESPLTVIQPLFWLVVGILLLIIVAADWLYQIIPDFASLGLFFLALSYRLGLAFFGSMQWPDFGLAIVSGMGLMAILGGLWLITKGKGMGFGDVKFALPMGILLGWPRALVGLLVAFWLGAVVGVGLLFTKKNKLKDRIAFGPFLVMGTVIGLIWGNDLWMFYYRLAGW